ncbi:MAG: NAD(P)-dependent oxidoreductase [Rhodospirillaceae bacterium]|jgi:3-hydroxyisobutyrate dehydrogenase-like beta-hydroxyacid dehydrogenase|nr:NAD(P)-dependent oxidoreductase [Rhodospirillaceae bacterium]MBT4771085.1 NAD(P)-dependent oxidoreductase [Rhodospirillaceae bacterium]MBT5357710.1 NAD(P)-dependent oxidoreductase [Rhodospirillaceae bacterium]MBT5768858.1 NAD(P)-dependent oxidoreductase [Rhodospirillaceae bacterium]MBT6308910.1 NAD(P)-dependent oxidoreductase [Rhodospirillaceae bacterium]
MALTAGIIGLGNIGCGVAANLAAAGHHVIGYDLDPERITAASAEAGVDAADVAARTDLVVLAVATLPAWRATLAAISASGRRGLVVVDLCTFPIEEKVDAHDELARAGIDLLDCPVSGARPQALSGDLAMLVSGSEDAFARVQPALESFCRSVIHVGAFGESAKFKYILNLIISIHNMACAEAFLLARKAGVDLELMTEAVMQSAAYSKIFEVRAEKWITGDYDDPTAELAIQLKDKDVIRDFAAGLNCPTPMFDATMPYYIAAASQGRQKQDAASILAVLEHMAGIPRDEPPVAKDGD